MSVGANMGPGSIGPRRVAVDESGLKALREGAQELDVVLRLGEPVEEELDALVRADGRQHPAHPPDHLEDRLLEEQLLASGPRALDGGPREDPLARRLP